jgi:ribosomal protein S13
MTRWTHMHTGAVGFAGGLIIDRHVLYVFALGLLLGALVVYSSRTLRAVGRAGASRVAELHSLAVDKLRAEIDRKRAATLEAEAKVEHRIRRADEQRKAERKAYIDGAIDGNP